MNVGEKLIFLLPLLVMSHFNGEFTHKIDSKGRVFIPRVFIDAIEPASEKASFECFINTVEGCFEIYTPSAFAEYVQSTLSTEKDAMRAKKIRRLLGANSRKLKVDSQGRILLPEELRQRINLESEVTLNGAMSYFEIWDSKRYAEIYVESQAFFDQATDEMTSPDYREREA